MNLPGGDGYGVSLPDTSVPAAPAPSPDDMMKRYMMMSRMGLYGGGGKPPAQPQGGGFLSGVASGIGGGVGQIGNMMMMKKLMGGK